LAIQTTAVPVVAANVVDVTETAPPPFDIFTFANPDVVVLACHVIALVAELVFLTYTFTHLPSVRLETCRVLD
jgi:hypothetical protein